MSEPYKISLTKNIEAHDVKGRWRADEKIPEAPRAKKLITKTLGKTIKFRAVTLFTTLAITWLLTGNPVTSIGLTVLQQSTNTAVYYFFEKNDNTAA